MNYLTMEFSGRTMLILGGLMTVAIVLIAVWLAKRYNKSKQNN